MTNSIFSQDSLSHLRACGWERCPFFLRFSKLSDQNINLFPINRSGILTNLWNFPLIQVFLIVYHWSALILFDRVFCPVIAFQTCSLAVCEGFRKAIVAAAKRELRPDFHTNYLHSFLATKCRPDGERKECQCGTGVRVRYFCDGKASRCHEGTRLWGQKVSSDVAAPLWEIGLQFIYLLDEETWGKETIGETKT